MPPSIERHILEEVNRYDKLLRIRWRATHPFKGGVFERWQVTRIDPKGIEQHIMFVTEPDGGYRPIDRRLIEHLARHDLWRYASIDDAMTTLELPKNPLEAQRMLEANQHVYGQRYHDWVEEFADRLAVAIRDDPHAVATEADIRREQKRQEQTKEAHDAILLGEGTIAVDRDVGGMKLVSQHG